MYLYEIWLGLNIGYEIALTIWPQLLLALLIWLALMVVARNRLGWRPWRGALLLGVVVTVLACLSIPSLTLSSLSNMGYWVDWATLLAMSLGCGAVAAVFLWPIVALSCPHCRKTVQS